MIFIFLHVWVHASLFANVILWVYSHHSIQPGRNIRSDATISFVKGFFNKWGKTLNIGRCGTTYQSPDKTYDLFKIFSFYWISIPIKQEEEIRNRQNPVMDIPIYTVDAFTKVPFEGNPAAICLVDPEHVICLLK